MQNAKYQIISSQFIIKFQMQVGKTRNLLKQFIILFLAIIASQHHISWFIQLLTYISLSTMFKHNCSHSCPENTQPFIRAQVQISLCHHRSASFFFHIGHGTVHSTGLKYSKQQLQSNWTLEARHAWAQCGQHNVSTPFVSLSFTQVTAPAEHSTPFSCLTRSCAKAKSKRQMTRS